MNESLVVLLRRYLRGDLDYGNLINALNASENEITNLRELLREERNRLVQELSDMTAERDSEQRWANQYKQQRDEARSALELIADHGGTYCADEEMAMTCNGSWCAEQARRALEETK
jgi:hypothetical protein